MGEEKIQKSLDKIHDEVAKIEDEVKPKRTRTYGDPVVNVDEY